jgi:predicted ArsR family transcriptional regulator
VAAFHLDKLADLGLLEVEYRRPPGRRGPGAGRPTKRYRRAPGEIALSVPERHYDLAAELLARAVEHAAATTRDVNDAVADEARAYGRRLWDEAAPSALRPMTVGQTTPRPTSAAPTTVARVTEVLATHGYEPRPSDGCVTLANCPFHALAEGHRRLVCAMNHALLLGLVEAAGLPGSSARLDPAPGRCCVTLVG